MACLLYPTLNRTAVEIIQQMKWMVSYRNDEMGIDFAGEAKRVDHLPFACEEPAVKQVSLIDAPAVLGWPEWREIDNRHGLGLTRAVLDGAVEAGVLRPLATEPMRDDSH